MRGAFMSLRKKLLLVLAFVLVTLVVPGVVLLLFVDALNYFSVYVVAFALILFAYIVGVLIFALFKKRVKAAIAEDKKLTKKQK